MCRGTAHQRSESSRRKRPVDRVHGVALDLDRHAALEEIDGEHQQPLFRPVAYEDALDACQGPLGDPDALAFAQVRIGRHRQAAVADSLDRFNLPVADRAQSSPIARPGSGRALGLS